MAEVGTAFVSILPSAKGFGTKLSSQVNGPVRSAGRSIGATFGKMFVLGASVIAVAGVGRFLKGAIEEGREAQKMGAATTQLIKQSGNVANVAASQVEKLATSISLKTGIDDEAIQSGENMLLTFHNIRNEVGLGNNIFARATQAMTDMQSLKGMAGIEGSSKALGKALQDPIKGVSALTKGGITFTEAQKAQITSMVESGNILGAQKLILGEVEGQVGGLAEAQATMGEKAKVAYDNIKESIGTALIPVLDKMLGAFVQVTPAIQGGLSKLGPMLKSIASAAVPVAREFADALLPALKQVFGFFRANPKVLAVIAGLFLLIASPVAAVAVGLALLYAKSKTVRTGFANLVATLQDFGTKAAPVVASVLRTIVDVVQTQVLPVVKQIATTFITQVVPAIASFVAFIAAKLVPIFISIVGIIRDQVLPIIASVANFFATQIVPAVLDVASSIASSLKPTLDQLFETFQAKILPALKQLLAAFQRAQPTLQKIVLVVLKVSGALLKLTAAVLGKVLPVLIRLIGFIIGKVLPNFISIVTFIAKVIIALVNFGKAVGNAASDVGSFVKKVIVFFAKLVDGVKEKLTNVVGKMKELPGKMLKGLGDLGHILYDAGKKIIQGLIDGISAMFGKLKDKLGEVGSFIKNHKGPPSKDRLMLVPAGRLIMDGLIAGIASRQNALGEQLSKVSKQVEKSGDDMAKKLKEKLKKVRDALSSVRDDIKSLVEPISSAFTGDLFSAETASEFVNNLTSTKGTLANLLAAFKKLVAAGLSPGFLYQLFQSGNAGLILGLAADPALAAQAGSLFGDVSNASNALGTAVAGATDKGQALEKQTVRLERKLDKLNESIKDQGDKVAAAVGAPARNARRRAVRA